MSHSEKEKKLFAQIEELKQRILNRDEEIENINKKVQYTVSYYLDLERELTEAKKELVNQLRVIQQAKKQIISDQDIRTPQPSINLNSEESLPHFQIKQVEPQHSSIIRRMQTESSVQNQTYATASTNKSPVRTVKVHKDPLESYRTQVKKAKLLSNEFYRNIKK